MTDKRKLSGCRGPKRPDSKPAKPIKNYRPAFEHIVKTGDLSSAPEKLATAFKILMESAKEKGVEAEVKQLLATYAEVDNSVVLLMLKRLERLVNDTPEGQLKHMLELCTALMRESPGVADSIPALLAMIGSDRPDIDSIRKAMKRRKSRCPRYDL